MTDEPAPKPLYYALTPEIAQELRQADPPLTAAEWRLWSLLVTLDPFGDRYQNMPDLLEMLDQCDMSKATFYRALAKFEEMKLFDTQPLQIAFRNLRGQKIVSKMRQQSQKRDSSLKNETTVSKMRQSSENKENKPAQREDFREGMENENVPIEQTDQTCLKTTKHSVPDEQEKEFGTSQSPLDSQPLLDLVTTAGIRTNKTIQKVIGEVQQSFTPAAARRAVENAVSAVVEQITAGNVRNPGGMLVDALRKGYTANSAKQTAKQKAQQGVQSAPPIAPASPSPNEVEISLAIDIALKNGDRTFALGKLQQLWAEGWHDLVRDLCQIRREWGFRIGDRGPVEREGRNS
jgi:hypothetical protein